jgi:hypothetical protein
VVGERVQAHEELHWPGGGTRPTTACFLRSFSSLIDLTEQLDRKSLSSSIFYGQQALNQQQHCRM